MIIALLFKVVLYFGFRLNCLSLTEIALTVAQHIPGKGSLSLQTIEEAHLNHITIFIADL